MKVIAPYTWEKGFRISDPTKLTIRLASNRTGWTNQNVYPDAVSWIDLADYIGTGRYTVRFNDLSYQLTGECANTQNTKRWHRLWFSMGVNVNSAEVRHAW